MRQYLNCDDRSKVNTVRVAPQVTVIALCFNHAKFLHECLDSIVEQTFQDFQLIITDDCSKDDSPDLIQSWIAQNRPDAIFIRHTKNSGLCKILNEALTQASGDFISMIATDDAWEPNKIKCQLELMRQQLDTVAVVYSDASRMDEAGKRLEKDFIQSHTPECTRPSGKIFSELAHRNFIPAMSTLIRRKCLINVGFYDERLSYEDYDMWLRLSAKYEFAFCPGTLARYRIVSTSLVRTIFVMPNAQHYYTLFLICQKWLPSGLLSPSQRITWIQRMWEAAYGLYTVDDPRSKKCLWHSYRYSHKSRVLLLALASSLGISRKFARRLICADD